MIRPLQAAVFAVSVGVLALLCGFGAPLSHRVGTPLIATSAPVYEPLAALEGKERFPNGAQLLLVRDGRAVQLIEGFVATADPNVSFDASKLLFAGKRDAGDRWSIWEFTFADRSVRKVAGGDTDVIRPLYLPGDRLVYARLTARGFQVEAAGLDGSNAVPLTYMAASAVPETVLADGRILFQARFPLGTSLDHGAVPELFLVYSDGSGVESYRCDHGASRWGGTQLASGDVVFTHGAHVGRFTSPLAKEAPVPAPPGDYAGAIVESGAGDWVVSARRAAGEHYALQLWKPGAAGLESLLARRGEDLVEPILLASRERPNRHPSALHKWEYANLLALDARLSRDGAVKGRPTNVRLESLEANGKVVTLGTAPVEGDGSFFVQVPGDRPIRFALLDEKGATLRAEHGWFWIRKGEQRYCVGCHAGPEHAPENRVPQVLLRTTVPVDLTGASDPVSRGGR